MAQPLQLFEERRVVVQVLQGIRRELEVAPHSRRASPHDVSSRCVINRSIDALQRRRSTIAGASVGVVSTERVNDPFQTLTPSHFVLLLPCKDEEVHQSLDQTSEVVVERRYAGWSVVRVALG